MLLYVSKVPIVVCLTSAGPKILTVVETLGKRCWVWFPPPVIIIETLLDKDRRKTGKLYVCVMVKLIKPILHRTLVKNSISRVLI